jgi:hypothetical protein
MGGRPPRTDDPKRVTAIGMHDNQKGAYLVRHMRSACMCVMAFASD